MERDFITTFEIGKYLAVDPQYLLIHRTRTCHDQAGGLYLWYKPFICDLERYFRDQLIKYKDRTPSNVEWACRTVKSRPIYKLWTPDNRQWFTVPEVVEKTGLTSVNILHDINLGELKVEKVPSTLTGRTNTYLISDVELLDWINRRNQRALNWSGRGRGPRMITL